MEPILLALISAMLLTPGSHETAPDRHKAIAYSIAASRSPVVSWIASNVAVFFA
jgi:hypothetical protein